MDQSIKIYPMKSYLISLVVNYSYELFYIFINHHQSPHCLCVAIKKKEKRSLLTKRLNIKTIFLLNVRYEPQQAPLYVHYTYTRVLFYYLFVIIRSYFQYINFKLGVDDSVAVVWCILQHIERNGGNRDYEVRTLLLYTPPPDNSRNSWIG